MLRQTAARLIGLLSNLKVSSADADPETGFLLRSLDVLGNGMRLTLRGNKLLAGVQGSGQAWLLGALAAFVGALIDKADPQTIEALRQEMEALSKELADHVSD